MQITKTSIDYCIKETKNCKNWHKFCYEMPCKMNTNFLDFLKQFGKVEILDFSKFSKSSKIFYKLNLDNKFTVEGVLNEPYFIVTVNKKFLNIYEGWISKFQNWYKSEVR